MRMKKFMAVAMAATMVVGNGAVAFAEDANSATGTGTAFAHVKQDVISITLPTTSDVANVFSYYVDPEGLVKDARTLANGTAAVAVTGNDDGVYFLNAGTTVGYSASSDAVSFEGKNSVDVDVSVKAEVIASTGGKDIALVADEAALAKATGPALLMKLKVGSDTKAITSSGTTATATIAGKPDNFELVVNSSHNGYEYKQKTDATDWASTTVQLVGKTNQKDVPTDGITAPQIKLTWTPSKHSDGYVSTTSVSESSKAVTLSLPTGVSVSSIVLTLNGTDTTLISGNHYSISGTTLTFTKYASAWVGGTIKVNYSDNKVDTLTCQ